MSDKVEYSRLIMKRSDVLGVTPTITSATTLNNFTDTDLFSGEIFLNTADERAFVRMDNSILEFDLVSSGTTDYNFCSTGILTSAISGCTPVDIYDDLVFQSEKNISSSNGTSKIELDFEGNTNTTRISSSGTTINDYLIIDPNGNYNGTELTSTDSTIDAYSTINVESDSNNIYSQRNKSKVISKLTTRVNPVGGVNTVSLDMLASDVVSGSLANINLFTSGATIGDITLEASNDIILDAYNDVRIKNPKVFFDSDADIQTQSNNVVLHIFTSTLGNDIHIGSSGTTVTISGNTYLSGGVSFDGNTNWVFTERQIGDWDMDTTISVNVAHNLSSTEFKTIRNTSTTIRNDADTSYYELVNSGSGVQGGISEWDSTNIILQRVGGGLFDSTDFDSTSYNRGFVTFWYKPD